MSAKTIIATWNVNSLRVRLPQVLDWLEKIQPDALALQETKLVDDEFPLDEIKNVGYEAVFSGQKTYNGVAWLTKKVISKTLAQSLPNFDDPQRRVLGVTLGKTFLLNVYIPNGQSIDSEKYQYKLNWLRALQVYLVDILKAYQNVILVGDFNIAPTDQDVHDPKRWDNKVLCSDFERQAFQNLLKLGLNDSYRLLHQDGQDYSWWDYRLNAFKRNWGLRIDHILISNALLKYCVHSEIDRMMRQEERPSDHAPVIATFNTSLF